MRRGVSAMEELLKRELGTKTLKSYGSAGGGCISSGVGYQTDSGPVFVKSNHKEGARTMFEGEFASLEAIHNTGTVRVPKPIKVLDHPKKGSMIVMEYLDMKGLSKCGGQLGEQLARLHLHNAELRKKDEKASSSAHKDGAERPGTQYISQFGFHVTTCCGFIPQDNSWTDDWPTNFTRRLKLQLDLIEKEKVEESGAFPCVQADKGPPTMCRSSIEKINATP